MAEFLLDNKSDIATSDILNILNKANLPSGKIVLLLTERKLDSLGECVPKCLLDYARRRNFFINYACDKWDCGVILSPKTCNFYFNYPAYFLYLLGHELGHAQVCLTDLFLHIHYCLIQEFIKEASNEVISKWHQLPHEIKMDQYGLFFAELFYTRDEVNQQISAIMGLPNCKDKGRLEQLLRLPASKDLSKLRTEIIKFSLPYKDNLIRLWEEDRRESLEENDLAITQLIKDLDLLFK